MFNVSKELTVTVIITVVFIACVFWGNQAGYLPQKETPIPINTCDEATYCLIDYAESILGTILGLIICGCVMWLFWEKC